MNLSATIVPTTLASWLSYLETLHPKAIDMGLERVREVAHRLAILPLPMPAITVTGTNGKGSSVQLLETIYQAAGYAVGAYSSPHLIRYNERIHINGREISDELLCQAFGRIEAARGDISLTYFEFGTLAALLLFKEANLSVVILEVGLGGRLDAVNIVDAEVAVITSIGIDHQEWLGSNRESIALEKAGIMRTNKSAVCGDLSPPDNLINHANAINTQIYCLGKDFTYDVAKESDHWHWLSGDLQWLNLPKPKILLQNAATVLQAITLCQSLLPVSMAAIQQGLREAFIPGRLHVLDAPRNKVSIILDVAHNPQAVAILANKLSTEEITGRNVAVFGMLRDKDIRATVNCVKDHIAQWYIADIDNARGCQAAEISTVLRDIPVVSPVNGFASIELAFQTALGAAEEGDRIVVFGSFCVVTPILAILSGA